jgi:hypothetical protein
MAMTAYLDESGTHGSGAGTVVVGGFISTEAGWAAYERDLDALLKANQIEYFHAKKLRKRSGPFRNFPEADKVLFVTNFFDLIDRHLAYGFAVSLKPKDFLEIYKARKVLPKIIRHDSQYGLCFRLGIVAAFRFMSQIREEWPLTVVIEGGHKNCGDAVRIFNEMKQEEQHTDRDGLLGPIVVELKRNCLPLAAADALVHNIFRSKSTGVPIPGTKRFTETTMNQTVPLTRSKVPRIQHFSLTRDQLAHFTNIFAG